MARTVLQWRCVCALLDTDPLVLASARTTADSGPIAPCIRVRRLRLRAANQPPTAVDQVPIAVAEETPTLAHGVAGRRHQIVVCGRPVPRRHVHITGAAAIIVKIVHAGCAWFRLVHHPLRVAVCRMRSTGLAVTIAANGVINNAHQAVWSVSIVQVLVLSSMSLSAWRGQCVGSLSRPAVCCALAPPPVVAR